VSEVEYRSSRLIFASPQVSLFWQRCAFLNSHVLGGGGNSLDIFKIVGSYNFSDIQNMAYLYNNV
jgi:hypothetical protein